MMYWILFLLIFSLGAQSASAAKDQLGEFFKDKSKIERPFELRDPFKAPSFKKESSSSKDRPGYFVNEKGLYSNISEDSVTSIANIKVVGVLIGRERRVMIQGSKGVIILKEGAKIGEGGAELKAILPGGIILVEKIINVYGQEEYLETVIPISK